MNSDFVLQLMNWITELNLPEPEIDYDVEINGDIIHLDVAYPDTRFGIQFTNQTVFARRLADWRIWTCVNEDEVYEVLISVSYWLYPDQVTFKSAIDLMERDLHQEALEQIDQISNRLGRRHSRSRDARDLKQKIKNKLESTPQTTSSEFDIRISFVDQLRKDAERTNLADLPFVIMGLFTPPQYEQLQTVDAVWLANYEQSNSIWAKTVQGHPTYGSDGSDWELAVTEVDLLNELLQFLDGKIVCVWNADYIKLIMRQWHTRAVGRPLPSNIMFLDLRLLALITSPTAKRIDSPTSFCDEHTIQFKDEMKLGGILAAMVSLYQFCLTKLQALDSTTASLIHKYLSHAKVPTSILDHTFPDRLDSKIATDQYLETLQQHFSGLPLPIQESSGLRGNDNAIHVADLFEQGGYLEQVIGTNYQVRQGQLELASSIETTLQSRISALYEAGTGIGKTKGYLVPLLLNPSRAFVATYTKNLQDQAWAKDVPDVLKSLSKANIARRVSILKGKSNYFCPNILADQLDQLETELSITDAKGYAIIIRWAIMSDTGWLSEIPVLEEFPVLKSFGRDYAGSELDERWISLDPHTRALEAAKYADLVLTNQSYVFSLALEQVESDIEVILFDEAHNVENVATEALTLDFAPAYLYDELRSLMKPDDKREVRGLLRLLVYHSVIDKSVVLQEFRVKLFDIYEIISNFNQSLSKTLQEYADDDEIEFDPDYPLILALDEIYTNKLKSQLTKLHTSLNEFGQSTERLLEIIPQLRQIPRRLYGSLSRLQENIVDNRVALESILNPDEEIARVKWVEAVMLPAQEGQMSLFPIPDNWQVKFHSTPLDIANWMESTLPNLYPVRIFLSATLAIGNSFESIQNTLGMVNQKIDTRIFPSPFNYKEQSLLAIPTTLPMLDSVKEDAEYIEAICRHIAELARIADGSCLVLFTSRKTMQATLPRLQELLIASELFVLMQSGGNRNAIVARFADTQSTGEKLVLLGLRSFWEGIDFPGKILQIVIISKLPFDYSEHPVNIARQELYITKSFGADYFREVIIPNTLLHLKQMFGRLIRQETDRGVCIIADPRIYKRRYGSFLLANISNSIRVVDSEERVLEAVRNFLNGDVPTEKLNWGNSISVETELSGEQLSAIKTHARRAVVHAAAGSGKTRVLVERIINIIKDKDFQAVPNEILALTYTNKAVDVMIDRLNQQIPENAFDINVMTYHKLATRIVRQHSKANDYEFNILNDDNPFKTEILQKARSWAGLNKRELSDEDADDLISYAQNVLIDENELKQAVLSLDTQLSSIAHFFLEFVRLLRENGFFTYSEIIVRAVQILRSDEDLRQQWSRKYKWMFCDEYQDTTPAQATLISLLGQYNHMFVVGDSAQSIYSWQGADPNNLRQFSEDFPNAVTFQLNTNYRCFPKLVETSDYFLKSTDQRFGGKITPAPFRSHEKQSIYSWINANEYEEARRIARLIREFYENSKSDDGLTVGILARKWSILFRLEYEFIKQEIAYEFHQTDVANGFVGDPDIQKLIDESIQLVQRAKSGQQPGDTLDGRIVQKLQNKEITTCVQLLDATKSARFIEITDETKYRQFTQLLDGKSVESLLKIYPPNSNTFRVVCSSIHSQKGEEFDLVIVTGIEEGNLPNNTHSTFSNFDLAQWRRLAQKLSRATSKANLTNEDMQRMYEAEEQRLFYVAMTRAKYYLILSWCNERDGKSLELSTFLTQLINSGNVIQVEPDQTQLESINQLELLQSKQSDRHQYLTNNGEWVRSKSEKILADEFHRRGIYYEYEAQLDERIYALPDFILTDYGGVIIEHLGLLDKPDYRANWEKKKQRYDKNGLKYFTTEEIDIQNVQATVSSLMNQIHDWFETNRLPESLEIIRQVEKLRHQSDLRIGRHVGNILNGVFEILDDELYVAICVSKTTIEDYPSSLNGQYLDWKSLSLSNDIFWIASIKTN